jgi:hypothetical protein
MRRELRAGSRGRQLLWELAEYVAELTDSLVPLRRTLIP